MQETDTLKRNSASQPSAMLDLPNYIVFRKKAFFSYISHSLWTNFMKLSANICKRICQLTVI